MKVGKIIEMCSNAAVESVIQTQLRYCVVSNDMTDWYGLVIVRFSENWNKNIGMYVVLNQLFGT